MSSMSTEIDTFHKGSLTDCKLDYYGKKLATASLDDCIKIWEINQISNRNSSSCNSNETINDTRPENCNDDASYNLVLLAELRAHTAPVWRLSWSHPRFGPVLASCSYDRKILFWKEEQNNTWNLIYEYGECTLSVNSIDWSPWECGLHLASGSSDGKVHILGAGNIPASKLNGRVITNAKVWRSHSFNAHPNGVSTISWAPCLVKPLLISTTDDNTNNRIICIVMRLATGGLIDNKIKIWHLIAYGLLNSSISSNNEELEKDDSFHLNYDYIDKIDIYDPESVINWYEDANFSMSTNKNVTFVQTNSCHGVESTGSDTVENKFGTATTKVSSNTGNSGPHKFGKDDDGSSFSSVLENVKNTTSLEEMSVRHSETIRDVSWRPTMAYKKNSDYLVSCSDDGKIIIWILEDNTYLFNEAVEKINSKKNCIYSVHENVTLNKSKRNSWIVLQIINLGSPVWCLSWSMTGSILVAASGDKNVMIFKENFSGYFESVMTSCYTPSPVCEILTNIYYYNIRGSTMNNSEILSNGNNETGIAADRNINIESQQSIKSPTGISGDLNSKSLEHISHNIDNNISAVSGEQNSGNYLPVHSQNSAPKSGTNRSMVDDTPQNYEASLLKKNGPAAGFGNSKIDNLIFQSATLSNLAMNINDNMESIVTPAETSISTPNKHPISTSTSSMYHKYGFNMTGNQNLVGSNKNTDNNSTNSFVPKNEFLKRNHGYSSPQSTTLSHSSALPQSLTSINTGIGQTTNYSPYSSPFHTNTSSESTSAGFVNNVSPKSHSSVNSVLTKSDNMRNTIIKSNPNLYK